jgi:hypothetical protein
MFVASNYSQWKKLQRSDDVYSQLIMRNKKAPAE